MINGLMIHWTGPMPRIFWYKIRKNHGVLLFIKITLFPLVRFVQNTISITDKGV